MRKSLKCELNREYNELLCFYGFFLCKILLSVIEA